MMKPNEKIHSIRKSIDVQEERVHQHNLNELRSRYENISKRESELNDLLSQEKARNRLQQLEIERRQKQLQESTELIRNLQSELEKGWTKARSMSSEIREVEFISKAEKEIVNLKTKITGMEARLKRNQIDLETANDLAKSNSELEQHKAMLDTANKELDRQKELLEKTNKTLSELDVQCEQLMVKLRESNSDKESALNEKRMMQNELENLRKQLTDRFKIQYEFNAQKDKNKLMENKIKYLERELEEANVDNRQELTKLSEQLAKQNSRPAQQQNETLESQIRQQTSQIRSFERQLEQSRKEVKNLSSEINELRKKEKEIMEENELLRQNFTECLQKAENFRDQVKEIAETSEQLKQEMERDKEKMTTMEDQIFEFRSEIEQKNKLIAYLQSVVQPKQMQKLPRPRSSLLSTESDFISEIDLEYKQCQQLEQRRNEMKADLEKKQKVLAEKQNRNADEIVPLLKDQTPFKPPTKASTVSLKHSCTESTIDTFKTPGKMRHDIPHRWKRQFVTINPNRCQVCMEGLPYFRHVYRCRDCEMTVHQHCKQSVVNTCGLPSECADFYLDTYSTSNENMTGWVKLLDVIPNRPSDKWRNAWACIEQHKLSFYENDQLAISDCVPFIHVNLDTEHWRIYNQTTDKPLDGVRGEDMSVLIELRMPNRTILMLTPTVQAKQRWVQALQYATNRRIFLQRRPSSAIVNNMLLLALESPQNLSINSTQMLGSEWLLIGAQEGLFATSLQQQQLRAPFQIAGIPKIFWMELLPEFDMLLTICGANRSLMCIHIQQLNRAFKAEQQPIANLTSVSNIEQCHIAELSKPEHNREKRFVYIATIDSIVILQYIAKLGVFSPIKKFKTEEPCMCICSTPVGFIYGADNFHFINFENDFSANFQLMVENCPFDFPVSVVAISDNEYLLAFHNFGLFVDSQGKRTRAKNVEWEKVPMEFVYTAPFLYIVYCEFLEVVRIAPLVGIDSGTLADDRNMFKCRLAHYTGHGLNPQEVFFSVSSEDRVELHSFSHYAGEQQTPAVKSILKRKMHENGALQSSGTKKKY